MIISDISEFWSQIDHVALGMTQATFAAQLRGVRTISLEADVLTLQAYSPANLEWLEYRLKEQIERGLSQVAGRQLRVRFVLGVDDDRPPTDDGEALDTPPPTTASRLVEVNHALAGFNQYTHYLIRFWRAYIGAIPFDTWQYVRSFCKDGSLAWTPARDFTGAELARGADCGIQRITGVWRGCPRFDQAMFDEGQMLSRCCEQYDYREATKGWPQLTRPTAEHPEGRRTCRHWVHGALEILEAEGLMIYQKRGSSPRNTFYSVQVYQQLPVLTPKQAGRFDNKLRIDHRRMLHGLLRAHQAQNGGWQYSLNQWERETIYSGLAALPSEDVLAGVALPVPEGGFFRATARNTIFFPCSSGATAEDGTARE